MKVPSLAAHGAGVNPYNTMFSANRIAAKSWLQRKLHPSRFPEIPQVLAAVVAFVLDAEYVPQPKICEIEVTNEGGVFARIDHEPGLGHYLAEYDDLLNGWRTLISVARLTAVERMYANSLFAQRVGIYDQMN